MEQFVDNKCEKGTQSNHSGVALVIVIAHQSRAGCTCSCTWQQLSLLGVVLQRVDRNMQRVDRKMCSHHGD